MANKNGSPTPRNKKYVPGKVQVKVPQTEPNHGWDDLNKIYMECCAVSTSPAIATSLLKNADAVAKVADPAKLVAAARVLAKDVKAYNESLQAINAKHKGRTGSTSSPDELMEVLTIGEEYASWLSSYQVVVMPSAAAVLEMFEGIVEKTDAVEEVLRVVEEGDKE